MKVYGNRMGVFLRPVSVLRMDKLHNLPTSLGLPKKYIKMLTDKSV